MRGGLTRVGLPALAVLVLVGVVAVAATGSTPEGGGRRLSIGHSLLDVVVSLSVVALVLAVAMFLYVLTQQGELPKEFSPRRVRETGILFVFLFVVLAAAIARSRLAPQELKLDANQQVPRPMPVGSEERVYQPHVLWLPVIVVLTLIALGVAAAAIAGRRQKKVLSRTDEEVADTLADVLEDALEDLRREPDSRRAVIAAYARLERVLAAYGLPRELPETPEEYLARILAGLAVDHRSIRRLTSLFTRAKFSQHEVDAAMKEEAIAALVRVRDELRAAATRGAERAGAPEAVGGAT